MDLTKASSWATIIGVPIGIVAAIITIPQVNDRLFPKPPAVSVREQPSPLNGQGGPVQENQGNSGAAASNVIANQDTPQSAANSSQSPTITAPSTAEKARPDNLGTVWNVTEAGWKGTWRRRGTSNLFDATWGNNEVTAVLVVSIQGTDVKVERRNGSDGNDCDYLGTLAPDEMTASGTYNCKSWVHGGAWQAIIR
jgi:hypothetical protein